MEKDHEQMSNKEALMYSYKIGQLSKALWKVVEKDWQHWIKPFGLNINEHQILWIIHHLESASISDIAKYGAMHVSTAFNFSKKLEQRGFLTFAKREDDKRNTYVYLTKEGKDLLIKTLESYSPSNDTILKGTLPLKSVYGKFPEFTELMCIIREIYGEEFTQMFEEFFRLQSESETFSTSNRQKKEKEFSF